MSTIYTFNNKVLKNSANDKWLTKKEAPAGFVMNASNAIYLPNGTRTYNVMWQSPTPGYNGNGKQYILVNNNSTTPTANPLFYGTENGGMASPAIESGMNILGTSTGVLLDNVVGEQYGDYLIWVAPLSSATLEQLQAYIANVSITIVDP